MPHVSDSSLTPFLKAQTLTMSSVGLKVTSLKWTGPDLEGSEAPPKIPEQIEYRDKMKREAEIERVNGESRPRILMSRDGTVMDQYLFQLSMLTLNRQLPRSHPRHHRKAKAANDDTREDPIMIDYAIHATASLIETDSSFILSR